MMPSTSPTSLHIPQLGCQPSAQTHDPALVVTVQAATTSPGHATPESGLLCCPVLKAAIPSLPAPPSGDDTGDVQPV